MNPSQRPLPDNIQRSQETDIHALGEIKTRSLIKRVPTEPRLRPHGHCDSPMCAHTLINLDENVRDRMLERGCQVMCILQ